MAPLIDLLNLEKKLFNRIKFIESIIFENDHLSDEEFNFYTKEYSDAYNELHKCQEEIRQYFTSSLQKYRL